ncbi:MAG: cation-transporting P-type ATPase, partial [Ruminiclostridium sp.]|nr:cation-transporting P-type ATPase [Ruminiclostridium sp.]
MEAVRLMPKQSKNKSNDYGLTEREAKKRQEVYGKNKLIQKKRTSWFLLLLSQFTDFMVLVLLGATAVSMIMGEVTEALTILVIVFLNAFLG